MVGRVSPNKGHIALLEAFATYYYHYNSNSRLILVGIEREVFKAYSQLIRQMAKWAGHDDQDDAAASGRCVRDVRRRSCGW